MGIVSVWILATFTAGECNGNAWRMQRGSSLSISDASLCGHVPSLSQLGFFSFSKRAVMYVMCALGALTYISHPSSNEPHWAYRPELVAAKHTQHFCYFFYAFTRIHTPMDMGSSVLHFDIWPREPGSWPTDLPIDRKLHFLWATAHLGATASTLLCLGMILIDLRTVPLHHWCSSLSQKSPPPPHPNQNSTVLNLSTHSSNYL